MAKKRVPHIVTQQIELIHEVFGLAINDSEIFPWWFLETYYVAQALVRQAKLGASCRVKVPAE